MILVTGTFRVDPARLDAARPAMARMIAGSRTEPGCLDYNYAEDLLDPGLIRVTERWIDREALAAHLLTAHIAVWRAAWPELGLGERALIVYETGAGEPF